MKLSQRVMNHAESATLAVAGAAARMKAEGIDVVGFGAGEPDFDTPDGIKCAAVKAIEDGQTKYPKPAVGLTEAREAVCAKFKRENDLTYKPGDVIITSGGKMAFALIAHAVLDPGDEVIIPKPYWVSYPEIVKLAGGEPVYVAGPEENDYRLRPDDIADAITRRTRMVVLNSPSNPSGVTYSPEETRALAEVLTQHDVLVISDEIYDRLIYGDQKIISYAAVSEAAYRQTVTMNSASKTYSMPGWRLGYAAGPSTIISAMAKLQSQTTSGAVTFCQVALADALTSDQSAVESMRVEFERRGNHMHQRLLAMPGVRCPKPTGAFYCFPNVAASYEKLGVSGSVAFCEKLLKDAKVAVVPGAAFGLDGHVRLSFATSMEQIDKGLDRLEAFLK